MDWLLASVPVGIWQALIAGSVVAAGWLVNGASNRRRDARLKEERLRDAHKAIYAEIRTTLAQFDESGAEVGEALIAQMRSDESFVPFIPHESHDRIYGTFVGQIDVLPRDTIDAVVAYYSVIGGLASLAQDMRGDGFRQMSQDRRIKLYVHYLQTRQRAFTYGEYALSLIAAYADGGSEAAQRAAGAFSTPAGGRGDRHPSQGKG